MPMNAELVFSCALVGCVLTTLVMAALFPNPGSDQRSFKERSFQIFRWQPRLAVIGVYLLLILATIAVVCRLASNDGLLACIVVAASLLSGNLYDLLRRNAGGNQSVLRLQIALRLMTVGVIVLLVTATLVYLGHVDHSIAKCDGICD